MEKSFITFEGGEGAGKTTVIELVKDHLRERGYDVLVTREPGGIPLSEKIREIILDPAHTEMEERTEALLYAAARRQHLVEKIIPALEEGTIVLCDRFIDSSLAYQGHARRIGMEEILKINEFAIETCMPALTIYFDIKPQIGLRRIETNANREQNRLDLESILFHEQVYEGYEILYKKYPERIKRVDANQSIQDVSKAVLHYLINHFKKGD